MGGKCGFYVALMWVLAGNVWTALLEQLNPNFQAQPHALAPLPIRGTVEVFAQRGQLGNPRRKKVVGTRRGWSDRSVFGMALDVLDFELGCSDGFGECVLYLGVFYLKDYTSCSCASRAVLLRLWQGPAFMWLLRALLEYILCHSCSGKTR